MRNEYKRSDIFLCSNQAHSGFDKKVSVYHVLKNKKCYPNGCVYFYWKCKKLNKGESCPKKYHHVGKNCFGCKEFYDVKITNQLKIAVDDDSWQTFQEDLQDFEDWLQSVKGRSLPVWGEIDTVKPHLLQAPNRLLLKGYILTFKECFIGQTHLEDYSFARVGLNMFQKFRFSPGDKMDFLATVEEDRGRIILNRLRRIEFSEHRENDLWSESRMTVVLSTAIKLKKQWEKCHFCPHGVLVDVQQNGGEIKISRRMYCLAGVQNPESCVLPALEKIENDECSNEEVLVKT